MYADLLVGLTVAVAALILVSSLDDAFVDGWYWLRVRRARRLVIGGKGSPMSLERLRARRELPFAIMVPAWREDDVIGAMLENTVRSLEYANFRVFCGVYGNDPATAIEVDLVAARHPERVTRVLVPHDGPTSKADCLNHIVARIMAEERAGGTRYDGLVLHDSEDVVHPLELGLFNVFLPGRDLVQLPVFSLPRRWSQLTAGTYMDDFAEAHGKDMLVRNALVRVVPGAGVATCYNRHGMAMLWQRTGGRPFNPDSLTEDYDLSFRLLAMGMSQTFAHVRVDSRTFHPAGVRGPTAAIVATHEYFPDRFRAAVRQRARWILGIAFQGWQRIGWPPGWLDRYFLFRDRKAIVMAPAGTLAYLLLANFAGVALAGSPEVRERVQEALAYPPLAALLMVNLVFMTNRALQRMYFVARYYGPAQGLLSLARIPVNSLVNFCAVLRAWRLFLAHHFAGRQLVWDKTSHRYPRPSTELS